MNQLKMIEELCNAYGAPGFEDDVLLLGRKYGEELADIKEDSLRDLYFYRKANTGNKPVVLLDGHSDECAFMVSAIKPNGTLKFIPLGGWTPRDVSAHKVLIRNDEGKWISGIVAAKPVHFMTAAERGVLPAIADMVIDVGATSEKEVREDFKISMAAPIVPDVTFEYNEKNKVMLAKAFDNRIGCAAVLATLENVKDTELAVDVVGSWSVQEEVGARGAVTVANTVKPDIAIVFEGCPADDTFYSGCDSQTAMQKGPMLRHIDMKMITNPRFQRFALNLAKKHNIDVQESVRAGGSTNGAPIHTSGNSVPVIVIGIPVRYAHSHHCFCSYSDYEKGVQLATEIVKELNEDIIKGF
ncbi:MAG: M20/M25/M40 family metallo-hydrolase [Oscillospiraceae bacterium]|nr:M20/M25/M40 family metallo-hydrolase [Oscillospiraceae bacterium]